MCAFFVNTRMQRMHRQLNVRGGASRFSILYRVAKRHAIIYTINNSNDNNNKIIAWYNNNNNNHGVYSYTYKII